MNETQKRALRDLRPQLVDDLDVVEVIRYLYNRDVLNKGRKQKLDSLTDDRDKCIELIDIITKIDCKWVTFLDAISAADQPALRKLLEAKGGKPELQQSATGPKNFSISEFERPIRLAANNFTLKSERENIAGRIDPHDAAYFMDRKGLSEIQVADITSEKSTTRATKLLLDALQKIENGYYLLLDYFNQGEKNKQLAKTLELIHSRYVKKIQEQVEKFLNEKKVLEEDVDKREILMEILKQKFDVKVDGRYIIECQ